MLTRNVYYSEQPKDFYIYPYSGNTMCRIDFPRDVEEIETEEAVQYLTNVYSLRTEYTEEVPSEVARDTDKWFDMATTYEEPKPRRMLKSVRQALAPDGTETMTYTDLGQTVYGGTVDLVSGVLTVTHGMYVMNGTESYTQTSTGLFRFSPTPTMASGRWYTDDGAKSDSYRKAELTSDVADGEIVFGSGNGFIYVRDSRATTIAEYQSLLASNNVTITYPLATPQTIQLTPRDIALLNGINNAWTDGEKVRVVWEKDLPQGIVQYPLEGDYTITYEAEDECGNKAVVVREIEVS